MLHADCLLCLLQTPVSQENPKAAPSKILMEQSNCLFRLVQNGAATEENNPVSLQIKFWCHAWLRLGKHFYTSTGNTESRTHQKLNVFSLLGPVSFLERQLLD